MSRRRPRSPLVLVAPDKFKGTLTAPQAAAAIAAGVRRALPDAIVRELPAADGGEGTVDALIAAGASERVSTVTGPLGAPVDARWAVLGDTAVIELAQASGLPLVPAPSPDTALDSATTGTGELIRAALDAGLRRIVLGVGGSASTDAGLGALRALGLRALDADGAPVPEGGRGLARVAVLDTTGLDPRLRETELLIAADVRAPLMGPQGAAALFAPQKGADAAAVAALEEGLAAIGAHVGAIAVSPAALETAAREGGAAGGTAAGLIAVLGARLVGGVDTVASLTGLDRHLADAALLVVGEGSVDEQTALGKTPVGLAARAQPLGIPVLAVAGRRTVDPRALGGHGIGWIAAATDVAPDPATALADPARWVEEATVAAVAAAPLRRVPGSPLPTVPTPYFHFLRTPRLRWWRPLLGLLALGAAFFVTSFVVSLPAIIYDLITGRSTPESLTSGHIVLTPALFLANNLGLAALIPSALLLQWAVFRQRPRWLSSVEGGFRWRWMFWSALLIVPVLGIYLVADFVLEGGVNVGKVQPDGWFLLVVVLLTQPLQCAGEEYAFRGFAMRAVAAWIPRRAAAFVVGTVVSSGLFTLAHSAADPWLNAFYFGFGVALSVLAWRTGGLEAGVLIHTLNNTVILVPTVLFSSISGEFDRGVGTGNPLVLIPILIIAAIVIGGSRMARHRVRRLGPPALVPAPSRPMARTRPAREAVTPAGRS